MHLRINNANELAEHVMDLLEGSRKVDKAEPRLWLIPEDGIVVEAPDEGFEVRRYLVTVAAL